MVSSFEIEPSSSSGAAAGKAVTMEDDDDVENVPLTGNNNGHNNSRQRQRRATMPDLGTASSSSGLLCITWFIMFAFFATFVIGLLGYQRYDFKKNHPPIAPATTTTSRTSGTKKAAEDEHTSSISESPRHEHTVYYNPEAYLHNPDPFNLKIIQQQTPYYGAGITPPRFFENANDFERAQDEDNEEDNMLGFLKDPDVVNNTLVFCAEGDMYLTDLTPWQQQQESSSTSSSSSKVSRISAMKLTTTVGNVVNPKLHPSGLLVAYMATYSGRRDIYMMDLRGGYAPATRITYWEWSYGITSLIGWNEDGNALIFKARSNSDSSVPDYRLYQISVQLDDDNRRRRRQQTSTTRKATTDTSPSSSKSPMVITPIPLAQAVDAAIYSDCIFFVRNVQSSKTIRYVGGTAEQMWVYQDGAELALRLFDDGEYRGTTKSPTVYRYHSETFLFVLTDRSWDDSAANKWIPGRMNIWAVLLEDTNSNENNLGTTIDAKKLFPVTDVSCEFEGRLIQEYAVDPTTGHVTVRIGADLYFIDKTEIHKRLKNKSRRWLEETHSEEFEDSMLFDPKTPADNKEGDRGHDVQSILQNNVRSLKAESSSHHAGDSDSIRRIPISVHSDFHEHQERLIPIDITSHLTSADIYETILGSVHMVMTLRGQLWVVPVLEKGRGGVYQGSGTNMPERRYRVAPGSNLGGLVRIMKVVHVPNPIEDDENDRRLAVILATDPLSSTAEQAFYLVETQWDATPLFIDVEDLPTPFLGGHVSGGPTKNGGLGSIRSDSVTISPCGRRLAWTDTDGRIAVMALPQYRSPSEDAGADYTVLPKENENGQPMIGDETGFVWSPGGRYLAVEHNARNQFRIITIVDCGDPQQEGEEGKISLGRAVQATSDRFNSEEMYWGKTLMDIHSTERDSAIASALGVDPPELPSTTTLFFLTDRDIRTDVNSPWGTRQPNPHFKISKLLYALPLTEPFSDERPEGLFPGGGASEAHVNLALQRKKLISDALASDSTSDQTSKRKLSKSYSPLAGVFQWVQSTSVESALKRKLTAATDDKGNSTSKDGGINTTATFPEDPEIDFGPGNSLTFSRRAYRVASIPASHYITILSQSEDGSIVLASADGGSISLDIFVAQEFPSDAFELKSFAGGSGSIIGFGLSSSRKFLYVVLSSGNVKVVQNTVRGLGSLLSEDVISSNIADTDGLHLSIWPSMEYHQMYGDAWRMLRDYFYDVEMTGIDWELIFERYYPLVARCTKREELDDVLAQMASELSALHVFVYGGEYHSPMEDNAKLLAAHRIANLGAVLERSPEWNGYKVVAIPERDPDFNVIDGGDAIYSPLSDRSLRLSGQKGLKPGDVIVGINGESVANAPSIGSFLRGMTGEAVRLNVLRLASGNTTQEQVEGEAGETKGASQVEPLVVVPLSSYKASDLQYHSWEWRTEQLAHQLAEEAGFSVGYVHLRDMSGPEAEDAFARGFFPNYDKEGFILDLRHNVGGNIDSWVLDVLQRKSWMYWQSRDFDINNGGLGWDEQFAFRGHLVVLIDEATSSDGEGVSRGISELKLGKLIGTRTWGGGIWLSSDNRLVDGGIASAPEIGIYNDNFGWGLGIENMGVEPDIEVDNNPRTAYEGKDDQLEAAINELKRWLKEEPIVRPVPPSKKKDMTMGEKECKAA